MASNVALQSTKGVLRKHIKAILKNMSPHVRSVQSENIMKKLVKTAAFQHAQRVSIYLSMETEVDTVPMLRVLFENNKSVYVPFYTADDMQMVRLHDMADYEQLPLTKWKIRQPLESDVGRREDAMSTGGLDLVIVPGVAFVVGNGARMGHGRGYYDRFFEEMFKAYPARASMADERGRIDEKLAAGKTVLIGLAYREQIVDEVPVDERDVLMDDVLTSSSSVPEEGDLKT